MKLNQLSKNIINHCKFCRLMPMKEIIQNLKKYGYNIKKSTIYNYLKSLDEIPQIVGSIGDTHFPYDKEGYLEFIIEKFMLEGVTVIVHTGDLIDQYCFSRFPKDPSAQSTSQELEAAKEKVQQLADVFPVMKICIGNHDKRLLKAAASVGIPRELIVKNYLGYPETWDFQEKFVVNNVFYKHTFKGGSRILSAFSYISEVCMSCVSAHHHSQAGVIYKVTPINKFFGANTGGMCDESKIAFAYAEDNTKKSVPGCLIVRSAEEAYFIPMEVI